MKNSVQRPARLPFSYGKCSFPMTRSVHLLVGRSVDWSASLLDGLSSFPNMAVQDTIQFFPFSKFSLCRICILGMKNNVLSKFYAVIIVIIENARGKLGEYVGLPSSSLCNIFYRISIRQKSSTFAK